MRFGCIFLTWTTRDLHLRRALGLASMVAYTHLKVVSFLLVRICKMGFLSTTMQANVVVIVSPSTNNDEDFQVLCQEASKCDLLQCETLDLPHNVYQDNMLAFQNVVRGIAV